MICSIIYYEDNSKAPRIKGFSSVENAKIWLDEEKINYSTGNLNAQIVVDYTAVEAYREMYELMRDSVFGSEIERKNKNVKVHI